MERDKMIVAIKQLLYFHKQATALEEEYIDEMYDFLVAEGTINLTPKEKVAIFTSAKRIYAGELEMKTHSDKSSIQKEAIILLRMLKINQLPQKEMDYITSMCKRMILKNYFDCTEKLNF